ncbi:MAG: ATP-binding protein [Desulfovibrionaceae bacterium]|nr:ATP-binding protein [Desulfovibrionaceae bacterium]
MLAGMPQKEVPGLELREQLSFGLNISKPESGDELELGHMMQEGSHLHRPVSLDRKELSKHVFIAGATGSGKTTTCHRLLASSATSSEGLPFLVVEPAKTEYRSLLSDRRFSNALIFTVGNEEGVPFRCNPFEFFPEESLSGHVDLLKANFMASFDMEAAIPNLLEEGLYRAYEAYGWNFRNKSNKFLDNRDEAWHCGGRYFPTISSYIEIILQLVDEKGFDERLRDEYKGSIRARLDSLRAGSKGLMLDTPVSVDFMEIIDKQVILELEGLKSGEDKAFLMSIILGRMTEALKIRHRQDATFRHITLIEEAHRLLTRPMPGDSPNRKLGVETFTDLLAEVRKYGESLIIVDQIPSKLAPEVLKNTNTKIIHKLFARDDKDVVGDTMALSDKQKAYLSHLMPGEAVVFSQGWKKPVDVQVEKLHGIATDDQEIAQDAVNEAGWSYWLAHPEIFCAGLSPDMPGLSQETIREAARLKDEFWMKLEQGADWRIPFQDLQTLLGEKTDALLLDLFSAWDMRCFNPNANERKKLFASDLPLFIQEFRNYTDSNWVALAKNVLNRSF